MTQLTPRGYPWPETTDRVADGWDAVRDLAVAIDADVTAAIAAVNTARANADTAINNALDARLDVVEAAHADTGWVAVSYATGWEAYGSGFVAPAYRRRHGLVFLRGMFKATGFPEHALEMFTLPAGYRPGGIHIFPGVGQLNPAQYGNSGPTLTDVGIRIQIGSDGKVTPAQGVNSNAGVVSWVSVSGICFPADA